jgi:hypothetical protein
MSTIPSQPSLKNSPRSKSEEKMNLWVMDQKNLEHKGIRILDDSRILLLQPNKTIPNKLKEEKCGRRWEREKRHGLIRHV